MGERVGQIAKVPEIKQSNSNSRVQKTGRLQSMDTPVNRILFLQRTAGNQAVSRLMKSGALQAKLRIGQPGDVYEQEADRVADAVMRMPEPGVQRQVEPEEEEETLQAKPLAEEITPLVQRQVEPEEEEEETLQTKQLANQITPLVQVQRQEEPEEEEETLQAKPLAEEITPLVQRQVEPEEEEEEMLQAKPLAEEITPLVQRQVEPEEEEEEEEKLQAKPLASQITPLFQRQPNTRKEEEEEGETIQAKPRGTTTVLRFGHDFSRVSVHNTGLEMIQTKLKINEPGDLYEQEVDRVADAVMRMPEPGVQRQVEPEEEEELQAKATSGPISEVNPNLESHIQSLKGGGRPLSENDRAFFEPRFGRDFSQVRVHTDANAASTAKAVNARAFTLGQDVVFGAEEYSSGSASDRKLIAHELTHVIQQNVSDNIKLKRAMSPLTVSKNEVVSRTTPIGIPKVQRLKIYGIKIKLPNMQDLLRRINRILTRMYYELQGLKYHAWSISKVTTKLTMLKKWKKWANVNYRMLHIIARNKKQPRKTRRQARIKAKKMRRTLAFINRMIRRTQRILRVLRAGWVYVGRNFRVNPYISAFLIVAMGRIRSKTGVDISRGSSSYRGLNAPTTAGRIYGSWHKTGRAIDLNPRERYVVVREGHKFRLYLRANIGVVGDIMGSRLPRRRIYRNPYGRRLRAMSLIDVTKIFLSLGFNRIPRRGAVAEWWHYEMVPSITWWQAMRQMYSYSTLRLVFRRHVSSGTVSRNYLIRKGVPPAVLR